ncbi:iron ABC transporter permease [Endozoicomonas gorgoniicola]|uniref:Iron ABC transporter permease n=1 Tax=Endozoicomonas gorgoniicola TaxID=1234144 RepID=A0ABT3N0J3_9GAMM|nr:iron ABC transporter permease [Endozoicomonas gorgoniicola]MCW7555153.1 iron ABC transporter permease [Endozoicomonas gorgoniicola]
MSMYSESMKLTFALLLLFMSCLISLASGPAGIDVSLPGELLAGKSWFNHGDVPSLHNVIVTYLLLPRTLMALLCGAALGAAGVLIQSATRNSFASPATLGINAGALLAIITGTIALPEFTDHFPVVVAFTGAVITSLVVFKLASAISHSPVNLVLVGMAVTLSVGAVSAGLLMFWENRLDGLYIWGAGNLAQFDFQAVNSSWWLVAALIAASLPLARRLDLIELGNGQAGSLGVNVRQTVMLSLLLALLLSATVVSQVGMISFIGLVAPHIARGLGYKATWSRLLAASLIGALLLLSADILARWMPLMLSEGHYSIPAGAMTTAIGAPFMIFLLTRRHTVNHLTQLPKETGIRALFRISPLKLLFIMLALLLCSVWLSLGGGLNADDFDLRWPRVAAAAFAGCALGVSGLVLQSLMRNPLASPDVSGLTTTGVLFVVVAAVLFPGLDRVEMVLVSMAGSGFALLLLLSLSRMTGFQPQMFALAGLCLSALASTLVNIALVLGSNQSSEVLLWLSGSTYAISKGLVFFLAAVVLMVAPLLLLLWRKLDILQLGTQWPTILGIRINPVLIALLLLVALLSSVSVATVGGISFVGLMAPHICRVLGLSSHRHLIAATAMVGAILLVLGDALSRHLMAPFELPAGLVVSSVGGVYFILLLLTGKYVQRR